MKKRLEAELISIAHRVLKLKNKSEINQLYLETQKLYETLGVLKFYYDNFEQLKSTVKEEELDEKLKASFENTPITTEGKIAEVNLTEKEKPTFTLDNQIMTEEILAETPKTKTATSLEEKVVEKIIPEEKPVEVKVEEPIIPVIKTETKEVKKEKIIEKEKKADQQPSLEDFLSEDYKDPVFVKPSELTSSKETKSKALNDVLSKRITIGLNDKVGFVKHLFADSNEDFKRVLSQLNTFNSLQEAQNFITNFVKPEYNDWEGKDDYAQRFMEFVEKKFN